MTNLQRVKVGGESQLQLETQATASLICDFAWLWVDPLNSSGFVRQMEKCLVDVPLQTGFRTP